MSQKTEITELKVLEKITDIMDDFIRVPGTNFRFGIDPILNFIPGAGAAGGYIVSAILVLGLIRNGASTKVAFRMALNVMIDAVVGAIPILGNIWDFTNKANTRNIRLMKEHFEEGKHDGSAVPLMLIIGTLFIGFFVVLMFGVFYLVSYLYGLITGLIF